MNVILLKDVEKLGLRGEVVNVARGYARNFLLPRNLAEVATEGRVKEVKRIDAQKAMHEARSTEQANAARWKMCCNVAISSSRRVISSTDRAR